MKGEEGLEGIDLVTIVVTTDSMVVVVVVMVVVVVVMAGIDPGTWVRALTQNLGDS